MAESWADMLEEAIQACGGSQAELGRQLERSPSVVGNWRMGRFKPDYESCLAIAEITRHSPDDVLRAAGHDPRRLRVVRNSDDHSSDDADLSAQRFAAAIRNVPRKFWPSVLQASIALARAYEDAPIIQAELSDADEAEAPISTQAEAPVSNSQAVTNMGDPDDGGPLAVCKLLVLAGC